MLPRKLHRPRSSYSQAVAGSMITGVGIAIQCQFCPGQTFRRSHLRATDIQDIVLMRYPVRCLRCSQRQAVSYTIAGISLPSHASHGKHSIKRNDTTWKNFTESPSGIARIVTTQPNPTPSKEQDPTLH